MMLLYLFLGFVVIQVFLSMLENKIFSFLLPFVNFLGSMVIFSNMSSIQGISKFETVYMSLFALIMCNVPTVFLLIESFLVRKRMEKVERDKSRKSVLQLQ